MTLEMVDRLHANASGSLDERLNQSLEAALDQHWSWVCHRLYNLLGDWDEAQDLALEAFWRLHTRPPRKLGDEFNLRGWLYRVATNLGLNAVRARNRRSRHEKEAGALRLAREESVDPEEEVQRRQIRQQVRRVLSYMRPRRAQLLLLRYTDHTYAEIADILGVAPGSVGTLLARAEEDFERRYRALEEMP